MKTIITTAYLLALLAVGASGSLKAQEKTQETRKVKVYVKENKNGKETIFEANELTPEVEKRLNELGIDVKTIRNGDGFTINTQMNDDTQTGENKNTILTIDHFGSTDPLITNELSKIIKVTPGEKETIVTINGEETRVDNNNGKTVKIVKVYSNYMLLQNANAEERKQAGIPESTSTLNVSEMVCTPNPSKGQFNICFKSEDKQPAELVIRDVNGKITRTDTLTAENGSFTKNIDLGPVSKGIYFLTITQNGKATTKKMLIE